MFDACPVNTLVGEAVSVIVGFVHVTVTGADSSDGGPWGDTPGAQTYATNVCGPATLLLYCAVYVPEYSTVAVLPCTLMPDIVTVQ